MKSIITGVIVFFLFHSTVFAGKGLHLEMKVINSKGANGRIDLYASDKGSRMEFTIQSGRSSVAMQGRKLITILRADNPGTVIRLNSMNKTWSEIPDEKMHIPDNQKYTVELTGRDTLNGIPCLHAVLTGTHSRQEVWTTDSIHMETFYPVLSIDPRWTSGVRRETLQSVHADGFPVKVILDNHQTGITTLELVNVEKVEVPEEMYAVPKGYKKTELSSAQPGTPVPAMKGGKPVKTDSN